MSRIIYAGETVIETFAVYGPDGTTPHTGAVCTGALWKNGVADATVVTITEIGTTGWYKASFTPATTGVWELNVTNDHNGSAEAETYDVRAPILLGVA